MAPGLTLAVLALSLAHCVGGQTDPCYQWSESSYVGQDTCVRVFNDQHTTFAEAQTFCLHHHQAHLAELRSLYHWEELNRLMVETNSSRPVWLGAKRSTPDNGIRWTSDDQTADIPSRWWGTVDTESPNPSGDSCLALGWSLTLETFPCLDRIQGFVCQKKIDNPCQHFLPGSEYFQGSCFLPVMEELSYCEARKLCVDKGAQLVEPATVQLIRFSKLFADLQFAKGDNIFIGCYKLFGSEDFRWVISGDITNVTDWGREEPNMAKCSGDVIVQMVGANSWQWAVATKMLSAYAICQKDISEYCDGVLAGGSCFTLHTSPLAWHDAKDHCGRGGSHLIELITDLHKAVLTRLLMESAVQGSILTGAADEQGTGKIRWVHSDEEYTGVVEKNRPEKYCLVWDAESKQLEPRALDSPFSFVCQRDFIKYIHTYVISIPRACAEDHRISRSASVCPSPISFTSTSTITETPTSVSWAALSAAYPHKDGGSVPVYIRLSFPTHPCSSHSSSDNGPTMTGTRISEETKISVGSGFHRTIKLTDLMVNSSDSQQTYILVRTTSHISLVLMVWREYAGDITSVCSCLVHPTSRGNVSLTAFFAHAASKDVSLDAISTSESPTTVSFVTSSTNTSMTFDIGRFHFQSWFQTRFSTTLSRQYETAHVGQMSGADSSMFVHSSGIAGVFVSGRDNTTDDVTLEQILPVSLVGSAYVTFPSLPTDKSKDSVDLFSAVAVFNDTLVQGPGYNITLDKAGDVGSLELPASGFHHVTGSRPFYLYGRLTAEYGGSVSSSAQTSEKFGMCSLQLLPQKLWRSVYTLHVSGPLLAMEVYLAMVVEGENHIDNTRVKVWDSARTEYIPTTCQQVGGTKFVGCYLKLPSKRQLCSIGDFQKPPLAAYVFARTHGTATCYQLGVEEHPKDDTGFNDDAYLMSLREPDVCSHTPDSSTEFVPTTTDGNSITTPFEFEPKPPVVLPVNLTLEQAVVKAEKIKEELKIDVKATSSFHRKKNTVGDFRTSSLSLGVITLVFVSLPFALIILVDSHTLVMNLSKLWTKHRRKKRYSVAM